MGMYSQIHVRTPSSWPQTPAKKKKRNQHTKLKFKRKTRTNRISILGLQHIPPLPLRKPPSPHHLSQVKRFSLFLPVRQHSCQARPKTRGDRTINSQATRKKKATKRFRNKNNSNNNNTIKHSKIQRQRPNNN